MSPNVPNTANAQPAADDGEYESVSNFDRKTVEMKKELEAEVYDKVMSDLNHVTWAYGVIFALFAAYGAYLLHRGAKLREDLDALQRQLDAKK